MSEAGASLDAAKGKAAEDAGSQQAEEVDVVLVRFKVKECYLYSVPPASSIGHRAETWGVEKWDKVQQDGLHTPIVSAISPALLPLRRLKLISFDCPQDAFPAGDDSR